jgi:5-methylcytosine-specific restriction endonuclease McrA
MRRDGESCQNCGATDDLTIDHKITPYSLGGSSTDPSNLQILCRSCNSSKGAGTGED